MFDIDVHDSIWLVAGGGDSTSNSIAKGSKQLASAVVHSGSKTAGRGISSTHGAGIARMSAGIWCGFEGVCDSHKSMPELGLLPEAVTPEQKPKKWPKRSLSITQVRHAVIDEKVRIFETEHAQHHAKALDLIHVRKLEAAARVKIRLKKRKKNKGGKRSGKVAN